MVTDLDVSRGRRIRAYLAEHELWRSERTQAEVPFRVALEPFRLPAPWVAELERIGRDLAAFQAALNLLYREAERRPSWGFVRRWLDQGKDETVVSFGRMRRLRHDLPILIRPDLLRSQGRFIATEIDAVPGGFGVLAALQEAYRQVGFAPLGGGDGIRRAFADAMRLLSGKERPVVAIVVSDESQDYRPEMTFLAKRLAEEGEEVVALHPRDLVFREEGLFLPDGRKVDVVYRFFELFDWKNVPKAELIFYAYKKERVVVTAPVKAYLEEKLSFALLHHPLLAPFWREALGEAFGRLRELFPPTWVVEEGAGLVQAFIYGLEIGGLPAPNFRVLKELTQKERSRFVLKPSGFSPLAWGSRGVHVGEDLPLTAWQEGVEEALRASREGLPLWCLQEYRKPERTEISYLGEGDVVEEAMPGRARISPYYFRTKNGEVELAGVLVTICPIDKKLIHGMVDGVVAPGGVSEGGQEESREQ